MRNGHEFRIDWSPKYRKWVFKALADELQDAATVKVDWLFDYKRKYANDQVYGTDVM